MKIFDTFDEFWNAYFSKPGQAGFDTWSIAKFTHTNDQEYANLKAAGKDTLGFQPTMLTLADPLTLQKDEVVIKNLPTTHAASLRQQYQQRFIDQLPRRFGLFRPDIKQADAIYSSWEEFAAEWLERDGKSLLQYNLPLLFDHVSDIEYWGWQQKGFDPCGTQRLIVTVFQYRTGRFAEVFITNMTDAEMSRIAMLLQSRLTLNMQELF
jgi:hypothetical protein